VEECFQAGKNEEAGLDLNQVRLYLAWYRCVTLAMLALAWLAVTRASLADDNDDLMTSANEIRRIFTALCRPPPDEQPRTAQSLGRGDPDLPERVRADPAVQRPGGGVHDAAPGQADPVPGADGAHRDEVPPQRGVVRVVERDPVGAGRISRRRLPPGGPAWPRSASSRSSRAD
jgi:hypothetical protein